MIMPQFSLHQDAALRAIAGWLKAKPGTGGNAYFLCLFVYEVNGINTLESNMS